VTVASPVHTSKLLRTLDPNALLKTTSDASRPRGIKMRPPRGVLWRASNVCQPR
jgi:hypothetical protein